MITRVFTLEIVCEGESFHDREGKYDPRQELVKILDRFATSVRVDGAYVPVDLSDSKGNLIGYTMMHEI